MEPTRFRIVLSKDAHDFLSGCSKFIRSQINDAIKIMQVDPYNSEQSIALRGNLKAYRRWVVGDYRIIYKVNDGKITVGLLEIGHRSVIYSKDIKDTLAP